MRRWNGWGDERIAHALPQSAAWLLTTTLGAGMHQRDATLEQVLSAVPASRLADHPLIRRDNHARLLHARGQSLPDWVALRSGRVGAFPDAVAFPEHAGHVRDVLQYARLQHARVIPYGGGTSVVGHITPPPGDAPVLTISMAHMNRLLRLDTTSLLATFGAGVAGPDLEAQLRTYGYTLGHFPQSWEYSTLGGWIATRSSGQQSLGYGRIEHLFAGAHVETPQGRLILPPFPASAAGPDLRELVLGSEGRLGVIAEATVRITRLAEHERFHAVFFGDWLQALNATRTIAQRRLGLSMLRVSTPRETEVTFTLAGHPRVANTLGQVLPGNRAHSGLAMLLIGVRGDGGSSSLRDALAICVRHGGVPTGQFFGRQWQRNRFRAPYLRNALWSHGYAVDTLETAATWEQVPALLEAITAAIRQAFEHEHEQALVFSHLSHVYPSGASIYTTCVFRLAPDPAQTIERWRRMKQAASRAILAGGGTISHQHGVGRDHASFLTGEKGELGMAALRGAFAAFDPDQRMNPGVLLGAPEQEVDHVEFDMA